MGTYYKNVEKFLDKIDNNDWIEIGADRGEGSTPWLAELASKAGVNFYCVDVDPKQISISRANLAVHNLLTPKVHLHTSKGEDFLRTKGANKTYSLVYLDNFDWDYWLGEQEEAFVPAVKKQYIDLLGTEMLNINSQVTHLWQAMLLMPMMSANSIFVCDDTWFEPRQGVFIGKCSAVIPFLIMHGYHMLHTDGYRQNSGAIFGKFENA